MSSGIRTRLDRFQFRHVPKPHVELVHREWCIQRSRLNRCLHLVNAMVRQMLEHDVADSSSQRQSRALRLELDKHHSDVRTLFFTVLWTNSSRDDLNSHYRKRRDGSRVCAINYSSTTERIYHLDECTFLFCCCEMIDVSLVYCTWRHLSLVICASCLSNWYMIVRETSVNVTDDSNVENRAKSFWRQLELDRQATVNHRLSLLIVVAFHCLTVPEKWEDKRFSRWRSLTWSSAYLWRRDKQNFPPFQPYYSLDMCNTPNLRVAHPPKSETRDRVHIEYRVWATRW